MNRDSLVLKKLLAEGNLRTLRTTECRGSMIIYNGHEYVNFSSNDYLGLSSRLELQDEFFDGLPRSHQMVMSNPSSRLMTGNSFEYNELEQSIASFMQTEAALVLSSGYILNSSLLRAITSREDVILADKLVHSSLIDGLKLSDCPWFRFAHNDMQNLRTMLIKHHGKRIVVVIESLYSMDGDRAPLNDLAQLQIEFDFTLVVDEAHAMAIFGKSGQGLCHAVKNLRVDYLVATLGKAICSAGAYVACNSLDKELLINRLKGIIFSTALPPITLSWSKFIIDRVAGFSAERDHLRHLIELMDGRSQIVPIIANSASRAIELEKKLKDAGFWVTAIRQPTVAAGTERIRISLTAAHSEAQVKELCKNIG
ncbi:MAG: 8-amino-7-oxononanoate synthase [Mucinivorans sp.]